MIYFLLYYRPCLVRVVFPGLTFSFLQLHTLHLISTSPLLGPTKRSISLELFIQMSTIVFTRLLFRISGAFRDLISIQIHGAQSKEALVVVWSPNMDSSLRIPPRPTKPFTLSELLSDLVEHYFSWRIHPNRFHADISSVLLSHEDIVDVRCE